MGRKQEMVSGQGWEQCEKCLACIVGQPSLQSSFRRFFIPQLQVASNLLTLQLFCCIYKISNSKTFLSVNCIWRIFSFNCICPSKQRVFKIYLRAQFRWHKLVKWEISIPKSPENCEMGCKAGSFYRIKDEEQGREKYKISDWLGQQSHACLGKEGIGNKHTEQS